MSPTTLRRVRWVAGIAATVALVVLALGVMVGRANRQQADDPRSTTSAGAGALGALLAAEGVQVEVVDRVGEAVETSAAGRALVVANGDELTEADAQRLLSAGYGRVILLRPDPPTLARFGVRAEARTATWGAIPPTCPADAAEQAGTVAFADSGSAYAATGPAEFSCYPVGSGGYAYLRVGTAAGTSVELVGGGVSNTLLDKEGNAAFAMNVFGAQSELTWLMARAESPDAGSGPPGLLPRWWPIALAQAAVAFGVVAVWRGRRLGPIMTEPLPVTVRASETVEGHGRLYHRLNAYDRAARALRAGTVGRLSRAYGHADDPLALSAVLADRTGLDQQQVRRMLVDARPTTDEDLVNLAGDLDRLEQEARRL
jgi:uncharacterized protein DUF4350